MITIEWQGKTYSASCEAGLIKLSRRTTGYRIAETEIRGEEKARSWLGDMGLNARLSRRLLDAAIRNDGVLARPNHPRRVAA